MTAYFFKGYNFETYRCLSLFYLLQDGIDISGSSLNDSGNHFDSVGLGGVDDEKSIQHMEQMLSKQRELMKREIQFVIDQRDSARSQVW